MLDNTLGNFTLAGAQGDMVEREVEPRPNVRMPMELGLRDLDRRLAASGVTTGVSSVSACGSSKLMLIGGFSSCLPASCWCRSPKTGQRPDPLQILSEEVP